MNRVYEHVLRDLAHRFVTGKLSGEDYAEKLEKAIAVERARVSAAAAAEREPNLERLRAERDRPPVHRGHR